MDDAYLTDAQIAAMSHRERAVLIARLARPFDDLGISLTRLRRLRQLRITMVLLAAVLLLPWTAYLAVTLPRSYQVEDWSLTWVGYDVILLLSLVVTIVLGLKRRLLVLLSSFVAGMLVFADAWFDLTTARATDFGRSLGSALLLELPLGLMLIAGAWRMLHLVAVRLYLIEPGQALWNVRLDVGRGRS